SLHLWAGGSRNLPPACAFESEDAKALWAIPCPRRCAMRPVTRRRQSRPVRSPAPRTRLRVEELETRLVPYSVSGNASPLPDVVTLSFVPDGTILGSGGTNLIYSNLFATFNSHPGWTTSTWQNEIIRAAQSWAQQTNINLDIVSDSGAENGTG